MTNPAIRALLELPVPADGDREARHRYAQATQAALPATLTLMAPVLRPAPFRFRLRATSTGLGYTTRGVTIGGRRFELTLRDLAGVDVRVLGPVPVNQWDSHRRVTSRRRVQEHLTTVWANPRFTRVHTLLMLHTAAVSHRDTAASVRHLRTQLALRTLPLSQTQREVLTATGPDWGGPLTDLLAAADAVHA